MGQTLTLFVVLILIGTGLAVNWWDLLSASLYMLFAMFPRHVSGQNNVSCDCPCLFALCRYEFVTGNGVHAVMAAAASKGQVYVAGGTCPGAQWQALAPALRQAVQSFKLI